MTAVVNGIQYIGGSTAPDEFIKNQAGTIDGTQTVENGVLAGPITVPGTITVTGVLVIVKIEVNTVAPQCGTTLTLGESGDTVQLGTGASQSGFGRTGTVDWQTGDIKTTTFTAVNGQGFFIDTNSGSVTANLPAGSAGAIVSFQDYRNTFDTAGFIITPNGS